MLKVGKTNQCNEFQNEIGIEFYEELLGLKERLQLKLDYRSFEGQCFELNKVLAKYRYFLRVLKLKKKFRTISKKDSEKQEMRKKFLAVSWRSLRVSVSLALNMAEN